MLRMIQDGDVNSGFGGKHALDEICQWLGLQGDVEHPLVPSLDGPPHAFAKIVDSTPICQSDHPIVVHAEKVGAYHRGAGLALIEDMVGITLAVSREVLVSVVVGGDVCCDSQRSRQRIGFETPIAWMHGYGGGTCGVVTVQQGSHETVGGNTPIVEGEVGPLL